MTAERRWETLRNKYNLTDNLIMSNNVTIRQVENHLRFSLINEIMLVLNLKL